MEGIVARLDIERHGHRKHFRAFVIPCSPVTDASKHPLLLVAHVDREFDGAWLSVIGIEVCLNVERDRRPGHELTLYGGGGGKNAREGLWSGRDRPIGSGQ